MDVSNLEFEKEKEQEQTAQYGDKLEFEEPKAPDVLKIPEIDENAGVEIPEEDQQLALFDVPEKKKETKKKTSSPKKADPLKKVDASFTVVYAGHKVAVPYDDMTLEEVRSFLEADYPELSKERAQLLLDEEKKYIIPVVKGAKNG